MLNQKIIRRARSALVLTAELTAIASALSFALAAAQQSFVFARWGLNYLQIATPGDVLLGGLTFLFDVAIIVLPAVPTYAIFLRLSALWARAALLILLILALVLASIFHVEIVAPFVFSYLGAIRGTMAASASDIGGSTRVALLSLTALIVAVVALWSATDDRVKNGYWPHEYSLHMPNVGCGPQKVLWTGERAVVAICWGAPVVFERGDRFVIARQPKLLEWARATATAEQRHEAAEPKETAKP